MYHIYTKLSSTEIAKCSNVFRTGNYTEKFLTSYIEPVFQHKVKQEYGGTIYERTTTQTSLVGIHPFHYFGFVYDALDSDSRNF